MGCATGVVKYFVFVANLVFALAGLALIIIGVLFKVKYSAATDVLPPEFGLAPILSIIIGAVVFVTAFMGCCGAVKESPCMLTTYAIILLTIFIIQVAIGVYAFLKIKDEQEFRRTVHEGLAKPFSKYRENIEGAKETVDVIQKLFGCCGLDGPDDFDRKLYNNGTLPLSCCWNMERGKTCQKFDSMHVHHDSCAESIFDIVTNNSMVAGGVILGIAAAELIGAFLGLCLASSIKNQYRRSLYA